MATESERNDRSIAARALRRRHRLHTIAPMPNSSIASTSADSKDAFRKMVFSSPLFRDVDEATKASIVADAKIERFEAGATLMKQGDAGDAIFFVLQGTVRIETLAGASSVALAELGPGACIGEVALVSGRARTATVTAMTSVECGKVRAETLAAATSKSPALLARLQRLIEARAQDAVEKIIGE